MGKAILGATGGVAAGRAVGQKAARLPRQAVDTAFGVVDGIKGIRDTYREGAYGTEDKEDKEEKKEEE